MAGKSRTSDKATRRQPGNIGTAGVTLVELLVVIAIIALLLAVLIPSLGKARAGARRVACTGNLRQIYVAVDLYTGSYDGAYPCADDPISTEPFYCLWMGRGWRSFVEPYLGGHIDVNNPSVLLCPADRTEPHTYESTSYAYSMAFYHSAAQIDAMAATSDTYRNLKPSISRKTTDVAQPAGKILIGEWFSNHYPVEQEKGWWNREGRRNFLFADGQIRFLKATDIRPARDGLPHPNLTVHGIKGVDWPKQ